MKKTIMAIAAMAAGMTFAAAAKPTVQEVFKDIKNAEFDNVKIVYAPEKVFWNMVVEVNGEKAPLVVESVEQKCRTEGGKLMYGPLTCGDKTFDMKVVVNVRDTPSGKAYSGVVENNDKRVRVTMFNGPRLDTVALDPAKAHIYIPAGFGRRLNYFPTDQKKLEPWERKSNEIMYLETSPYPSRHLTMPWIAIDTGSGTWYAAVHDAQERFKRIGVRWYNRAKKTDVRFRHSVSIRAGDKWALPETVFEKVDGDWHAAAKRYRAWFDSAHQAVRSAAPDWTRDLTGWLLVIMKQQNEELMWSYTDIPKLCDVAERNGLNSIGLFGWTVGGHDHLYPDYDADPKMGGAAALKAGIAEAHRRGIRVCIYANGQLQQIGATKFWGEHGERIAVRRRDGSPYVHTYHKYRNIPVYQFAIGCLHTEPWHDRMLALARQPVAQPLRGASQIRPAHRGRNARNRQGLRRLHRGTPRRASRHHRHVPRVPARLVHVGRQRAEGEPRHVARECRAVPRALPLHVPGTRHHHAQPHADDAPLLRELRRRVRAPARDRDPLHARPHVRARRQGADEEGLRRSEEPAVARGDARRTARRRERLHEGRGRLPAYAREVPLARQVRGR